MFQTCVSQKMEQIYFYLFLPLLLLLLSHFSCVRLCNPIPGILQARTLEWVAISFSNAWKWKVKVKLLSWVRLSVTPWTAAYQAPLSMGFSRQEYWSGVPLPSPSGSLKSFKKQHLLASHNKEKSDIDKHRQMHKPKGWDHDLWRGILTRTSESLST